MKRKGQGYKQKQWVNGVQVEVGTLVIDGKWEGIRIKKSSGTHSITQLNAMLDMLDDFEQMGNTTALVWCATKGNKIKKAYEWWKRSDKKSPPWDGVGEPLTSSMREWIEEETKIKEETKRSYRSNINIILRNIGKNVDVISSLPAIVRHLKGEYKDQQRAFNSIHSTAQSYITSSLGREHKIWKDLKQIGKYPVSQMKRKRLASPFYPLEITNAFHKHKNNQLRDILFFLCSTGMRPDEYLVHGYEVHDTYIHIKGKKTSQSDRVVPKVFGKYDPQPALLGITKDTLRDEIKRYFSGKTARDCRYSFINWAQEAGIEYNRLVYYLGHQQTQTQNYLRRDVIEHWVEGDAVKLREYIQTRLVAFPKLETRAIKAPKTIDDLGKSADTFTKSDIINHLNEYLLSNYPRTFRKLYEVEGIRNIQTI